MEVAKIAAQGVDISTAATLFTYTYTGNDPRELLARVDLGRDSGPIAGGGSYLLSTTINGIPVSPATTVQVGVGVTRTVLVSRALPLEKDDVLALFVTGQPEDTAVDAVIGIRDATPLRLAEIVGVGPTLVDHDYGGVDALTYRTSSGAGISGASIQVFLAADYAARNRGPAFVVARSETGSDGRWVKGVMLSPGEYTVLFFRQGLYGPDTMNFTVP